MLNTFARICLIGLAVALLTVILAPNGVAADDWNKKTLITLGKPIEVPGRIIPPGRYIFEIVDLVAERHVVRISDEDGAIYATVIAIPNFRLEATEETVLTFYEAVPGAPEPLRAWFYPNHRLGVEFVYPKRQAVEIAEAALVPVIAANIPEMPARETAPTAEALAEPVIALEPEAEEIEIARELPVFEPVTEPELIFEPEPEPAVEEALELPKTATPIPLLALLGILAAAGALVTRRYNG